MARFAQVAERPAYPLLVCVTGPNRAGNSAPHFFATAVSAWSAGPVGRRGVGVTVFEIGGAAVGVGWANWAVGDPTPALSEA